MKLKKWNHKVNSRTLGIFCNQFAITLGAGITIVEALDLIGQETNNKAFGKDILDMKEMVKRGSSLSASSRQFPNSFPYLFIRMAETGELGGSLDKIMNNLGKYYEKQANLKSNVVGAVLYPILVLLVAIIVILFLLTNVLPTFVNIYETMQSELPKTTQILMLISSAISRFWPLLILGSVIFFIFYKGLMNKENFAYRKDQILLKIPLIGGMITRIEMVRIADSLSILLSNGIDLISALSVVKNLSSNRFIMGKIDGVKNNVKSGRTLAKSFEETQIFKLTFYHMVKVGECSGTLDTVLINVSEYYNDEIKRYLKLILTIIEPLILLIVGGLVFFIIIAIMMPVFEIYSGYSEL